MELFDFEGSSAAFRIRIALNLKGIDYARRRIDLFDPAAPRDPAYLAVNPQAQVPALIDGEAVLTQSMAIIEYLDEVASEPPILPAPPAERARVRALAQIVACDMHPLNNLRVKVYLNDVLALGDDARDEWYAHWIGIGYKALESLLAGHPATGRFCHGDAPTLADICLVPQVFNNFHFHHLDLGPYPTVKRIFDACMELPTIQKAAPELP